MLPIVRLYGTAKNADKAVSDLKKDGFDASTIHLLKPGGASGGAEDEDPERRVAAEIEAGRLPPDSSRVVAEALRQGRHVVTVFTAYGAGRPAQQILDACSPVDAEDLPESYTESKEPRLMSEALGLPMISKRRFFTIDERNGLAKFRLVLGNFFGLPPVIRKAAPLSSAVGMKTLQDRPKDWQKSLGLPLLSDKGPAPLSSAVGMKTVSERPKGWTRSLGLPLLSTSAAPLSEALGLPVLKRKTR